MSVLAEADKEKSADDPGAQSQLCTTFDQVHVSDDTSLLPSSRGMGGPVHDDTNSVMSPAGELF